MQARMTWGGQRAQERQDTGALQRMARRQTDEVSASAAGHGSGTKSETKSMIQSKGISAGMIDDWALSRVRGAIAYVFQWRNIGRSGPFRTGGSRQHRSIMVTPNCDWRSRGAVQLCFHKSKRS